MELIAVVVAASLAAGGTGIEACAEIDQDAARLKCFDGLVHQQRPKVAQSGGWTIQRNVSEMDDSALVVATLKASKPIQFHPGGQSVPELFFRCREKQIELYVVAGVQAEPGVGNDTVPMRMRLDEREPEVLPAGKGASYGTYFLPFGPYYLQSWTAFSRLRIEFTPLNSPVAVMDFDITGFANPYAAVFDACK